MTATDATFVEVGFFTILIMSMTMTSICPQTMKICEGGLVAVRKCGFQIGIHYK